jgi:hypothetical protein
MLTQRLQVEQDWQQVLCTKLTERVQPLLMQQES